MMWLNGLEGSFQLGFLEVSSASFCACSRQEEAAVCVA